MRGGRMSSVGGVECVCIGLRLYERGYNDLRLRGQGCDRRQAVRRALKLQPFWQRLAEGARNIAAGGCNVLLQWPQCIVGDFGGLKSPNR